MEERRGLFSLGCLLSKADVSTPSPQVPFASALPITQPAQENCQGPPLKDKRHLEGPMPTDIDQKKNFRFIFT